MLLYLRGMPRVQMKSEGGSNIRNGITGFGLWDGRRWIMVDDRMST